MTTSPVSIVAARPRRHPARVALAGALTLAAAAVIGLALVSESTAPGGSPTTSLSQVTAHH